MNRDPGASPSRDADASPAGDAVELCLPPRAEHLRLARFAAADAAARAGLDVDAVDDVRLAISELCSLLIGSGAPITLSVAADGTGVVIEGRGTTGPELERETGELARVLAEAVVDEYEFVVDGTQARFRVAKARRV